MEDIDECLLIANIEVSCWKDQMKHAVSQLFITNIFHAIQSFFLKIKLVTSDPDFISYPILFLGICRNHLNTCTSKYHSIQSRSKKGGFKSTPAAYNQRPDSMWGTGYITRRG